MSAASYFATAGAIRLIAVLGHFLWQGALIALLAAGLARMFVRKPRARRWVFRGALLLLLAAPPLTAYALGSLAPHDWILYQRLINASTAGTPGLMARWLSQVDPEHLSGISQPLSEGLVGAYLHAPASSLELGWKAAAPVGAALYLLVVLLVSTRVNRRLRIPPSMTEHWVGCYDPGFLQALQRKARALGLGCIPPVMCSDTVTRPILLGLFAPTLVLPRSWVEEKSVDDLMACLERPLHEMRMHASCWSFFESLAQICLFFHPVVWWVIRQKHDARRRQRHPSRTPRLLRPSGFPATAIAGHAPARPSRRRRPAPAMAACHARRPGKAGGGEDPHSRNAHMPKPRCIVEAPVVEDADTVPEFRFLRMHGFALVPISALLCLGILLQFGRVPTEQGRRLIHLAQEYEGPAQPKRVHGVFAFVGNERVPVACIADSCTLVEEGDMLEALLSVRAFNVLEGDWELELVLEDEAHAPLAVARSVITTTAETHFTGYDDRSALETFRPKLSLGPARVLEKASHFHLRWYPPERVTPRREESPPGEAQYPRMI